MQRPRAAVQVVRLGRISYSQALREQQRYVQRHRDPGDLDRDPAPHVLLVCEHPPVYTVGLRQAPYPAEEERRLGLLGADFFRTNRGGMITFHGPGQLVCYPVLDLRSFGRSVRRYVGRLESTCHRAVRRAGRRGVHLPAHRGLGIHCGRYITSHGLALNVSTDLSWFKHIVPCGIVGKGVTSLSEELDRAVAVEEVLPLLLDSFSEHFGCDVTTTTTQPLPPG
ncbi:putative lipoyltransferase 2, mitochondrial [Merluccius polli]|uniref:Octanoyl-[acyl-carrier-protein]:protein N-octanoyltransferase LIPT2, mitochondrial n=1 Tax=Merluccius polli TaxID=89951 RepID=A0AA47P8D0_MERPO|nr:putative lipoyltransferase 2, mitochondrial [Merluccius polli]